MSELSERQICCLKFVEHSIREFRRPPSLRELARHMGYKAIASAQELVNSLVLKGYLCRAQGLSRGLSLAQRAIDYLESEFYEGDSEEDQVRLPYLGRVVAGLPVESFAAPSESLFIPRALVKPADLAKDLFVLKCVGSSMEGAGLFEGDLLIFAAKERAHSGAIVLALVNGEATVKRLIFDQSTRLYGLKAENPRYQTLWLEAHEVFFQGVLKGLYRSYA